MGQFLAEGVGFVDLEKHGKQFQMMGHRTLERIREESAKHVELTDAISVSRAAPFKVYEPTEELLANVEARLRQLMDRIGSHESLRIPEGSEQWLDLRRVVRAVYLPDYIELFTKGGTYAGTLCCAGSGRVHAGSNSRSSTSSSNASKHRLRCPMDVKAPMHVDVTGPEQAYAAIHRSEQLSQLVFDHEWGYEVALDVWAKERKRLGLKKGDDWRSGIDAHRLLHTLFSVFKDEICGEAALTLRCHRCAAQHIKSPPPQERNVVAAIAEHLEFRRHYINMGVYSPEEIS